MTVRISGKLVSCVHFARFAKLHKIDAMDLAELLSLADKAFHAGEREANGNGDASKQRNKFEEKAEGLGFWTEWNGLGPTLRRDDETIYLPAV